MLSQAQDAKSRTMRISELCKISGFSKSTIHKYIMAGLLPPPLKARTNLYLYDETHLLGLERIKRLRETKKLSLEQVKKVLNNDSAISVGDAGHIPTPVLEDRQQAERQAVPDLHLTKKLQIMDKAIILFSKYGYQAVKVSDITDALQMGKGTFYLYFKNKKELFLSCFERLGSALSPIEMKESVKNEKDCFLKIRNRWIGFNEEFSVLGGLLPLLRNACYSEEKDLSASAKKAIKAVLTPLTNDFDIAKKEGTMKPLDSELAAYFVVGMSESLSFRLNLDSRYSTEEVAQFLYTILRDGLISDEASEKQKDADQGCRVTITDRSGVKNELTDVRFDDAPYLTGKSGEAKIQILPTKMATISVNSKNSKCFASITTKSGEKVSIEVDGATILSGNTTLGDLEISIEKLSFITICDES